MKAIVTLRDGLTSVHPGFPEEMRKVLRYWKRELVWDESRMRRVSQGSYEDLYTTEGTALFTPPGLSCKVLQTLEAAGWEYTIDDQRTPRPAPDLEAAMVGLRDYQMGPVLQLIMAGGGIGAMPTGWGKSFALAAIVNAFPYETLQLRGTPTTVICAPDKAIVKKNWEMLQEILPDREIGIIMSGHKKIVTDDIMVTTIDSVHHVPPLDVGVLIIDEIHAAASDNRSEALAEFSKAMTWGVSATPTGRYDGKDLVTEGLAGPQVVTISYEEGVACGALVPITVYMVELPEPEMGINNYLKFKSRDGKYRHGVLKNPTQCEEIAKVFARAPEDMQVLGIMRFLEQMNAIAEKAPSVMQVHGEKKPENLLKYPYVQPVSAKERDIRYTQIETCEVMRAMSTHIFKQGVDFRELQVVINCGGGGSEIVTKQLVGRASRKTDTKTEAYLVDFWHEWDMDIKVSKDGKKRRTAGPILSDDKARERSYKELGFNIIRVKSVEELPFLKRGD